MFLSSNQLDTIVTKLEEISGDPRNYIEDYEERLVTAIEAMSDSSKQGDHSQRLTEGINKINLPGGGGGEIVATENGKPVSYYINTSVTIASNVTNTSSLFFDCSTFNQPVNIPDGVTVCRSMFYNCFNFNQSVSIPDSVVNCETMFKNCKSLNVPINISNNAEYCGGMFNFCESFNQVVNIPDGVTNCDSMFYCCYELNQPFNIPDSVNYEDYMFYNCRNFNSPVKLSNNSDSCSYMFFNCQNFDQPITIPDGVYSCSNMFRLCSNFNHPVILPDSVSSFDGMLCFCPNMNSDIRLPNVNANYVNTSNFFRDSFTNGYHANLYIGISTPNNNSIKNIFANVANRNFEGANISFGGEVYNCVNGLRDLQGNFSVGLSNYIQNCSRMIYNCTEMNNPVDLANFVYECNCGSMFYLCNGYNQSTIIGNKVNNCASMFYGCKSLNSPVTFKGWPSINSGALPVQWMFGDCWSFNQPVNFPITSNVYATFTNCYNFNSPVSVLVSNQTTQLNMSNMLKGCTNFNSFVYVNTAYKTEFSVNVQYMFNGLESSVDNAPIIYTSNLKPFRNANSVLNFRNEEYPSFIKLSEANAYIQNLYGNGNGYFVAGSNVVILEGEPTF